MICTNVVFLRILLYFKIALQVISIAVPIGLIVKLIMDFYKGMVAGSGESLSTIFKNSFNRIVAAIIVFLTPMLVNFIVSIIENTFSASLDYQSCLANVSNIEYYENLEREREKQAEDAKRNELLQLAEKYKQEQAELVKNNLANASNSSGSSSSGSGSTGGVSVGQKYNLTNSELEDLAKICQREQGSAIGAAAEASLMANRYELEIIKGSKWKNSSLYDYVMNCGWWAPANKGTYKNTNLKSDVLSAVREVLIDGQRTLPFYVDEHDWVGDLEKIVTNGKTYTSRSAFENHSNYVQNSTVIYNKMGAVYTYYTHPTSSSDPFGYTSSAKNRIDGLSN